jgi:NADH-quinone oxidoreductase subunit K
VSGGVPLAWYLVFSSTLFAIGLLGVLVRRNAIAVLMAIELMLNAANVNFVAFWRHGLLPAGEGPLTGPTMGVFVITVAAAEVAVGIALVLVCYRKWRVADVDRYDVLRG